MAQHLRIGSVISISGQTGTVTNVTDAYIEYETVISGSTVVLIRPWAGMTGAFEVVTD